MGLRLLEFLSIYLSITVPLGFISYYVIERYRNSRPIGYYTEESGIKKSVLSTPFVGRFLVAFYLAFSLFFFPTVIILRSLRNRQVKRVALCYKKNRIISDDDEDYFLVKCNCQYSTDPGSIQFKSECERLCKKLNK